MLELLRPPNIITAWADVLAGMAAAGAFWVAAEGGATEHVLPLILATSGLYGGGVVLNDVFDADLDAVERPERPIPRGAVSRRTAAGLGYACLALGIVAAWTVNGACAMVAAAVAVGAVVYDAWGKHHGWLGPLNMGLCRGGNLLLGVSVVPAALAFRWYLALLPIVYIAAITAISRGEVHGGRRAVGWMAVGLFGAVVAGLVALELLPAYSVAEAGGFVVLLVLLVGPFFVAAARTPEPAPIRRAVRAGVTALIVLNAALAAGFAGWLTGLVVLALLPVAYGLARLFAVT